MKKRLDISKEFAKKLNSNKINTMILFGSVARGENLEDSDTCWLISINKYIHKI